MVRVKYNARIIVDKEFVEWLIDYDKSSFFKLTHIKASSLDHKREHNIILKTHSDQILKINEITSTTLFGAFKALDVPSEVTTKLPNEIDQIIVFAIVLATSTPYKTYIFTTKDKAKEYEKSSHYNMVKSISVKANEDAITIINSFWRSFTTTRELSR